MCRARETGSMPSLVVQTLIDTDLRFPLRSHRRQIPQPILELNQSKTLKSTRVFQQNSSLVSINTNGPKPTLPKPYRCCGAARLGDQQRVFLRPKRIPWHPPPFASCCPFRPEGLDDQAGENVSVELRINLPEDLRQFWAN